MREQDSRNTKKNYVTIWGDTSGLANDFNFIRLQIKITSTMVEPTDTSVVRVEEVKEKKSVKVSEEEWQWQIAIKTTMMCQSYSGE